MVSAVQNPSADRTRGRATLYLFGQMIIGAAVLILGGLSIAFEFHFGATSYGVAILYALLAGWCCFSWIRVSSSCIDLYFLMLVATILFNGGHFFTKLFHPATGVILRGSSVLCAPFKDDILMETAVLVFWGISFMHLGALFSHRYPRFFSTSRILCAFRRILPLARPSQLNTRRTGYLLIALSVVPMFLIQRQALALAMSGGYKAFMASSADMGYGASVRILSSFLIPGALFALAGSRGRTIPVIIASVAVVAFSATEFVIGDRSAAVMPLLMYLWVFQLHIRRIPRAAYITAALILLLWVLPAVQIVRQEPGKLARDPLIVARYFADVQGSIELILDTMGNSMGSIAHTLRFVPDDRAHSYGMTYLRGLSTIVPNLFWEKHPGSDFMGNNWFVRAIAPPERIARGWGTGYSIIAEAYYNFSWVGVPIVMLAWGAFLGKLMHWVSHGCSPAKTAMAAAFGAFILQIPRGWLGSAFRPLVWYSLIPFLIVALWPKVKTGTASETPPPPQRPNQ